MRSEKPDNGKTNMIKAEFESIDQYIAAQPKAVQPILLQIRSAIAQAAPQATEKISYRMPTFFLNGNLVHFAAFDKHIGFYPTASGISAFQKELAGYKNAKGSVQFPIRDPLPLTLIRKIVKFRVEENSKKIARKK
jgi:uncharacterized protein YdhG (YjbR/CyaY superfamily)